MRHSKQKSLNDLFLFFNQFMWLHFHWLIKSNLNFFTHLTLHFTGLKGEIISTGTLFQVMCFQDLVHNHDRKNVIEKVWSGYSLCLPTLYNHLDPNYKASEMITTSERNGYNSFFFPKIDQKIKWIALFANCFVLYCTFYTEVRPSTVDDFHSCYWIWYWNLSATALNLNEYTLDM